MIILSKIKKYFFYFIKTIIKYWQITLAFIAGIAGFIIGRKALKDNNIEADILLKEADILIKENKKHQKEIINIHKDNVKEHKKNTEEYIEDKKSIKKEKEKEEKEMIEDNSKIDNILKNRFNLKKGE